MRKQWVTWSIILLSVGALFAAVGNAAGSADTAKYVGAWPGNWEGGGAGGKFDVTFTRGADGALSGSVSVMSDQGNYTAKFSTLSFDGNKMTAKYDYPLADQAEISLQATFEGSAAKGTWALGAKGQGDAMATGTWSVTKK